MPTPRERFDRLEIYCRKLGHVLPFAYCRREQEDGLPCARILDCWHRRLPIANYLRDHFDAAQLARILEGGPSLLERILQKARQQQPSRIGRHTTKEEES